MKSNETDFIVNKYFGGLGNQMFQYVFGLNLEKSGKTVMADISWYHNNNCIEARREFQMNRVFPAIHLKIGYSENKKRPQYFVKKVINFLSQIHYKKRFCYQEKKIFAYDENAINTNRKEVEGYWQHHQYVDNVSDVLKKEFVFAQSIYQGE